MVTSNKEEIRMLPSTEARVAAQESLTVILHARNEQVTQDMQNDFQEVMQDIKHLWRGMDASFRQNAEYQVVQERNLETCFD